MSFDYAAWGPELQASGLGMRASFAASGAREDTPSFHRLRRIVAYLLLFRDRPQNVAQMENLFAGVRTVPAENFIEDETPGLMNAATGG